MLISQVLGFVSGPNIRLGFERLYEAMAPGAKLFVINYTPFISITEAFLPEYEARKHRGVEWPGHVDRLQDYCKKAALLEHLPDSLNLMDIDVLQREAQHCGFRIEEASYLGGEVVPEKFRLDGREWVLMIAIKDVSMNGRATIQQHQMESELS